MFVQIDQDLYELLKNVCYEYIALREYVRLARPDDFANVFEDAFDYEQIEKIIKVSNDSSHVKKGLAALFEFIKGNKEDKEEEDDVQQ